MFGNFKKKKMKNTIDNLLQDFKSFQESDTVKNHMQLVNLSDVLLNDFSNDLREEPFYSFSLDVINELMSLRLDLGTNKIYDNSDLDLEITIRIMKLLKCVVPSDEKMQKVINRIFKG